MSPDRRFPGWIRYSGVGLELAVATAGLALVGSWVDRRFGTSPWGTIGGVVIGLAGGLFNLVKESLRAAREARSEDELARDAPGSKERGGSGD